jgi:hypothetical protein
LNGSHAGGYPHFVVPNIACMTCADIELEDEEPPSIHKVVLAAGQPLPKTKGFSSVFDLAAMSRHMGPLKLFGNRSQREEATTLRIQDCRHLLITRDGDRVSVRKIHYLDTPEWQAKEAARRARQIVPRPPKQEFKMRGSLDKAEAVEA